MDIRPIFSALRQHKTAASLIVLEIAFTCAILCNALFLVRTRVELMERPTGLVEAEIVRIRLDKSEPKDNAASLEQQDVAALRALPGVKSAASANALPLGMTGRSVDVKLAADQSAMFEASYYLGDEQLLGTMGLNLIAGRGFTANEVIDWEAPDARVSSVIITRSMADRLFPGESPLGKSFYAFNDEPVTVVGVVEHLSQPHGANDPAFFSYSIMVPAKGVFPHYLIRVSDPARRAQILELAVNALRRIDPNRLIVRQDTVEEMRSAYYERDREMARLLIAVCVAQLVVTAAGIVGLTSFWVQQRTRQIGIRRALGATRGQILRYFQIENFLLASVGIALGTLLAYGLNQWLLSMYELSRLPLSYLPIGAAVLWLLGQIAVLWPARRAATIPPAIATRLV